MPKARANSASAGVPPEIHGQSPPRRIALAAALIVLATWAAYANTLSSPFVFDDLKSIVQNPTIRHLGSWSDVLSPPNNLTGVVGRPVVNLSLAVNYAIGGFQVTGYHVFNTLVHALAGLTLFGIVRRTLLRPGLRERFGAVALPLAWLVAMLWVLHPLQTESVTCIVQRSESLMGLFYLLTLYGFIRSVESTAPLRWQIFTWVICLAGMATKEVMISAPLLVLLYDRTFVAGTFRAAWQQRWRFHVALMATAGLLIGLVVHSNQRGGNVGLGLGVSSWDYALTQCRAIILYLRLTVWPHPLVVDYGTSVARSVREIWPQGVLLVALVAVTLIALRRWPKVGFLAFGFFAILAPSSSVVPLISQTIAEHRIYLPLAAVVVLVVLGGYLWLGQRVVPIGIVLMLLAGWVTIVRNEDFRDPLTLWTVTVDRQPDNVRAQLNLGTALLGVGRPEEAREHFATAVKLSPTYADAHYSLAGVLLQLDRLTEAQAETEAALRIRPGYAEAHYLLGTLLLKQRQADAAIGEYETALRLKPDFADAEHTLAGTLAMADRLPEALKHYEAALRLQPDNPKLHEEMALQLAMHGREAEAVGHFEAAVRLDPDSVPAHYNFGKALFALRRYPEAAEQYTAVVRLRPEFAEAHNYLANTLVELGRLDEAQAHYEEAVRLQPDYDSARENLAHLQSLRTSSLPPARE